MDLFHGFSIQLGIIIIPTDELIFFRRDWNHQPVVNKSKPIMGTSGLQPYNIF